MMEVTQVWACISTGDSETKPAVAEGGHLFAERAGPSRCDPPGWDQLEMGEGQALPCTYSLLPLQSVTWQHVVSDFRQALDGAIYKTDCIPRAKHLSKRKATGLQNV